MTDYLHPGKTTAGHYYAEPTFKLFDIIQQTHWRKLSLSSMTFSWQCTSAQVTDCSASSLRLSICSTEPPCLQSRLGFHDHFLIRNLKYRLRGTWFIDDESLTIVVDAWFGGQNTKFYFQGINSWQEKLNKCTDVAGKYVKNVECAI